jgi:DDE superfamily endonuclease
MSFLQVMKSRPKGWTFATSNTGGVTEMVMTEFAAALHKSLVQKGLLEKSSNKQKVFLFLRNNLVYVDIDFIQFCDDHGIVVFCLPPNSKMDNPVQKAVATHFDNIWAVDQQRLIVTKSEKVNALNVGNKLAEALQQIKCNPIKTSFE